MGDSAEEESARGLCLRTGERRSIVCAERMSGRSRQTQMARIGWQDDDEEKGGLWCVHRTDHTEETSVGRLAEVLVHAPADGRRTEGVPHQVH